MNGRRATLAMSTANAAALLAAVGGYFAYSRLLSPADFALYASALAIAKFGTLVLDGGIKLALIKEGGTLEGGAYRSAFLACGLLAGASTVCFGLVLGGLAAAGQMATGTAVFLGLYAAAYFATYPILVIPLADLERTMRFGAVARAEGLTVCIEYGLPAVLWIAVRPGLWSFVASVWLARTLRAALLLASSDNRAWLRGASTPDWRRLKSLFGVGLQFQLASLASMLRDNLHLLVVGPMFGRELAGLYAWVMQLCGITSQVFVQTASRVSLPWLLAIDDADSRWRRMLPQIVWLTVLTFPPLLCLHYIAPTANHAFFQDKWTPALGLLPFLIWRMLPGLATTPLGTMLIAQRGSGGYVSSNCAWTIAEVIAATACMYFLGGRGLAVSYSFMAWFGVVLFATRIRGTAGVVEVLKVLLLRPSVWVATILTLPYAFVPAAFKTDLYVALAYSLLVCLLSTGSESCVREGIRRVVPRLGRLRNS